MDPPYAAISKTSNFMNYTKHSFNKFEQMKLAKLCNKLAAKGCKMMISNHWSRELLELYSKKYFEFVRLEIKRLISSKVNSRKRVISEVLILTKNIWANPRMNAKILTLKKMMLNIKGIDEPFLNGIPYPQANDLNRVLNLASYVYQSMTLKEELLEICTELGSKRQINYYADAARYLNLIVINSWNYLITSRGIDYYEHNKLEKNKLIIKSLLEIPSIRCIINHSDSVGISTKVIVDCLSANGIEYSDVTLKRRADCIKNWFDWIFERELN